MVYDSMRFFPNYEINPIHIKEPFDMELAFFGIFHEGSKITLNQFFEIYQNSTFDVLSGIVYLTWVPIPIVLAIFWYFKNAEFAKQFIWAFILTGILGAVGYYLYPAAPPWYVAKYGFNFVVEAKGSAAGLTRFDQMFDISIFEGIYGASSNIYGAIPSIHCANPVVVCFFLVKKYGKKLLPLGLFYIVWMWFGAVYSSHHYLIDAFAGLLTAFIGIMLSYLFVKK